MQADDAFNYGAIGVVIGHEMTHGFDDQGRQFDKDGNLKNWWTEADAKKFNERAKVMSDFYDSIYVAPGVHANGKFTLGETLADFGGLQIAYQAFKEATAAARPISASSWLTPSSGRATSAMRRSCVVRRPIRTRWASGASTANCRRSTPGIRLSASPKAARCLSRKRSG